MYLMAWQSVKQAPSFKVAVRDKSCKDPGTLTRRYGVNRIQCPPAACVSNSGSLMRETE